ncbi:MAG: slipin family protein [Deltaproteobacteria bacterium]|nr:slipin family protein [Deltaproteobacteria bacterium]
MIFGAGIVAAGFGKGKGGFWIMASLIIAFFFASAVKVASQWERTVILRLGKYNRTKGPGIFFIIPVIDTIPYWIDLRVFTAVFQAEQTLTKDNVPVNVDAVLFWRVIDPERAALDVEDYALAVHWAAQTALRDIIGKSLLSDILVGREKIDADLKALIHDRINPWGTEVQAVEIRDVIIPQALQDAMSMQAQAERERQARIILGDSERQIAQSFEAASNTYINNPTALHLRAMNMLYEGLKGGQSTIVLVPSTAIDTMNLGAIAGITTMAKEFGAKPKTGEA